MRVNHFFTQSPTKNSPKSAKIEPRIWLVDWLMIAIQYCQRMFQAVLKFQFLEHVPFFGEITLPPIKSKRFLAVAPLFLSEYLIIIEPKSAAFETFNPFFQPNHPHTLGNFGYCFEYWLSWYLQNSMIL